MFASLLPSLSRTRKSPADRPARTRKSRSRLMEFDSLEQRKVLSTAAASAGLYRVEVWTEQYSPTDSDIYARVSYNGSVVNNRVPVALSTHNEWNPSVSINSSGQFAVAYEYQYSSSDIDIYARTFNGAGTPLSGTVYVATTTHNEYDPDVDINYWGQFVVGYEYQYSSSDMDIYARSFNIYGTPQSGTLHVASSGHNEWNPAVAINSSGRFVVANEYQYSSSDIDLQAHVYSLGGASLATLTVANTGRNEWDPDVDMNDAGRFVVAYDYQYSSTDIDVYARQFTPTNAAGTSYSMQSYTAASSTRNEFDPSVSVAWNGNFAVSYTYAYSSTDLDVYAVAFRGGVRSGPALVAVSTANETSSTVESYNGGSSLFVSYDLNGSRRGRNVSV